MASVRRHTFARLTALSLMLTTGGAGAESLRKLPTEVVSELIEAAETSRPRHPQRLLFLSLLAEDPRPAVRAQVAETIGGLWPEAGEKVETVLHTLAQDGDADVREGAAIGLARAVERARAPERIELVCRWATSERATDRAALARALTWPTPVFVADLLFEQLAGDENVEVRSAALSAAVKHFREDSPAYARVVERAASDPDRGVRRQARALLGRGRG